MAQAQEQKQLTPDRLMTGERITTPRGSFHVTAMSREQMEAAGYGFHHQSDDGKYLIMGNGKRAFAVAAELTENYLKAAGQNFREGKAGGEKGGHSAEGQGWKRRSGKGNGEKIGEGDISIWINLQWKKSS